MNLNLGQLNGRMMEECMVLRTNVEVYVWRNDKECVYRRKLARPRS